MRRFLAVALAVALLLTFSGTALAAKGGNKGGVASTSTPTLMASCGTSACSAGGSLTVSGSGYPPSFGGQQIFLWVGYPNDYCAPQPSDPTQTWYCHGIYVDPWVATDGTFSLTLTNVLWQSGTGSVVAYQYSAQKLNWVEVASTVYPVP